MVKHIITESYRIHSMKYRSIARIFRIVSMLMIVATCSDLAIPQKADVEYRSYLAHIAAASNALRVNENGEARRWIDAAPVKYRGWEWAYLNAQTSQHASSRSIHTAPVTLIAVSPDGKLLASASSDRTVKLIDSASRNRGLFVLPIRNSRRNLSHSALTAIVSPPRSRVTW